MEHEQASEQPATRTLGDPIVITDGDAVGAVLDRNGLRPSRYTVTTDGRIVMASESGLLALAPEEIAAKGVCFAHVTLHVGAGTFQPVRVDDIGQHVMHHEYCEIDAPTCASITRAQQRGGRIVAVGTTVVRTLETAAASGELSPYCGETNLFITPGYRFRQTDALLTNFHLPESTLLMLVCAFAGYDRVMAAYRHAIEARYRFFSYGDAMFIPRPAAG